VVAAVLPRVRWRGSWVPGIPAAQESLIIAPATLLPGIITMAGQPPVRPVLAR
jgi:hypothetical protein